MEWRRCLSVVRVRWRNERWKLSGSSSSKVGLLTLEAGGGMGAEGASGGTNVAIPKSWRCGEMDSGGDSSGDKGGEG